MKMKGIAIQRMVQVAEKVAAVRVTPKMVNNTWFIYENKDGFWDLATSYFFVRYETDSLFQMVLERAGENHMQPSNTLNSQISNMLYPKGKDFDALIDTKTLIETPRGDVRFLAAENYCVAVNEAYMSLFKPDLIFGSGHIQPVILSGCQFMAGVMPITVKDQEWLQNSVLRVADLYQKAR